MTIKPHISARLKCLGCEVPEAERKYGPQGTVHVDEYGMEFTFECMHTDKRLYKGVSAPPRAEQLFTPVEHPELPGIESTLAERGKRYGVFAQQAAIIQGFKAVAMYADGAAYMAMKPDARHAMDVIFDKFARMLNGDPEYDDNWRDIQGYAALVLKRIEAEKDPADRAEQTANILRSRI